MTPLISLPRSCLIKQQTRQALCYTVVMTTMQQTNQLLLPDVVDIETTLFSGQTFSWAKTEDGCIACIGNNAAYIHADSRVLYWTGGVDAAYWKRYFDLERDYAAAFSPFWADAYIQQAYASYGGMRILNQPVWETLCAFIISANNNIKRITTIMTRIRERLGEARSIGPYTVYAFPSVETFADAGEALLKELGLGYRAAFLYQTAQRIKGGFELAALPRMGYEEALKALITLPGVGEKVADCVLLFSCGYTRAFPVDVWVKRIMRVLYGAAGSNAAIKAKGYALFGEDAGIVQQVLFHGARMGLFPLLCETDQPICDMSESISS